MAMVRCRECGGEVSSEAAICPHCGIRDPAVAAPAGAHHAHPADTPHARPRRGRGGWGVALLLLLVLLALFGLWYGNIVDFN